MLLIKIASQYIAQQEGGVDRSKLNIDVMLITPHVKWHFEGVCRKHSLNGGDAALLLQYWLHKCYDII